MASYIHSIVTRSASITAGDITQIDLPVNPISHLQLVIDFLNDTAHTRASLANLCAAIDRIEVQFKGSAIISLNGLDLYVWSLLQTGKARIQENHINLDNAVRSLVIPIPFGRQMFNAAECFPATSRGNLTLNIDWNATFTNFDTVTLTVEAVELPGATPQRITRVSTLSATPAATGDFDIALPIGNPMAGILLWGTTIPTGTTATTTIDLLRLLLDNTTHFFTDITWESMHEALMQKIGHLLTREAHFHDFEDTAGAIAHVDTEAAEFDDSIASNHGLLDFAPLRDDNYLLETAGASAVTARIIAGDTNPLRVVPIELITVPTG